MIISEKAWECPRCGRMNAPWRPYCCFAPKEEFSKPEIQKQTEYIEESRQSRTLDKCLCCGGFHGVGLQCISLIPY